MNRWKAQNNGSRESVKTSSAEAATAAAETGGWGAENVRCRSVPSSGTAAAGAKAPGKLDRQEIADHAPDAQVPYHVR